MVEECAIVTEEEADIALTQVLYARNRFINRSGYSAHQRVFGNSLRLPGSFLSDDLIDNSLLSSDPTTEFGRTAEMRHRVQQALLQLDDKMAVDRARLARSRI